MKLTPSERKEGNTIIQEWMGWKLEPHTLGSHTFYDFIRYDENGNKIDEYGGWNSNSWNKDSTMPYDLDWNLLMTVVEKIESIPQKSIYVQISGYLCDIIQTKRDPNKKENGGFEDILLISEKHNDKRFLVWKSVIEFIKFHTDKN